MLGPYVHTIDPIITSIAGIHLWWYGLSYALGFLNAHLYLRRSRERLGLSLREVFDLTLFLSVGVLVGGRSLVVFNNEWDFYRDHLSLIPAIWLGGLATHGLIVGGAAGVLLFCWIYRRPFRPIFDEMAIAAALILGCGRIGNFIDGQIVGSVTDVPWAVKFPEAEGFRHPVVLYDGLKNFLLIPILWWVRRRGVPPGRLAALFVFLYPALRIPIDLLREYPITLLGLPTGQTFNIVMTFAGAALLIRNMRRQPIIERDRPHPTGDARAAGGSASAGASARPRPPSLRFGETAPKFSIHGTKAGRSSSNRANEGGPGWRRVAFAGLLALALVIPSDATRDVPSLYGKRHPGLVHSFLYPRIG